MAQIILPNLAARILAKLSSLLSEEFGTLWGLKDDVNKLTCTVSIIRATLVDADTWITHLESVVDWLEQMEAVLKDAEDVLDEFSAEAIRRRVMTRGRNAKQVRIFFSNSNQLVFNFRMARQVKKIRERLDAIGHLRNYLWSRNYFDQKTQQYDLSDQTWMGRDTHSSIRGEELIGRDDAKNSLKDLLLNRAKDHISFIAIVGMGGIGKTTLAKFLYNDPEVSPHFDILMWVWVSEQFHVNILVEKIIMSATKSDRNPNVHVMDRNPNVHAMDFLQRELKKVIQNKKYLLVMDDVWNDQNEYAWRELKNLLMDGAERGSKIIITKRDSRVATEIKDMTKSITLDVLDEDSSWSLFKKVAFKQGQDSKYLEVEQLGKEILKKCGGVPLVIRHIGRLLSSKTSKEEWMSFNDNESLEVTQQDNHMTSILELSYNNLPPHLKQCFAYSSLFPKGYKIKINELIGQWIAQDFIESSSGRKSLDNIGKDYFDELCSRFFYENLSGDNNFDDYVRMHDVMRELAKKVAGNKYYARGDSNNSYVVSEQTRHISFDYKIELWRDVLSKLLTAKGLKTFLILHHLYEKKNTVDRETLDKLFSSFPRLRVLGLHDSKISTVPDSIEKLTDLRYLDLSENDIESLPNSITKLQNLQTLKLTECHKLKELPRNTKKLVNLRHLAFDHCIQITHMPEGMEKLTSLQTITLFVFDCKKSNKLSELNELNYSKAELKITGLEQLRSIDFILPEVGLVNLKHGWRSLKLEWELSGGDEYEGEGDKKIMECLIPHPYLESLSIKGYCGVGLPEWVSAWPFWKLTQIEIVNCHRLQYLPSIEHLHALGNLRLQNLRSLEYIDFDSSNSSSSVFFPSLKFIWLQDLPNLVGWGRDDAYTLSDQLAPTFPQLCFLEIFDCPKLISIPKLPSIRAYVHLYHVGVPLVKRVGLVLWRLGQLKLEQILGMELLPEEFYKYYVTFYEDISMSPGLRWLEIIKCPNLTSLPTWINRIISLETLRIISCPNLKSLPAEIGELQYLLELQIKDCPELEERCKQGGEDWLKISSIPYVTLGQIATVNDTPYLSGGSS